MVKRRKEHVDTRAPESGGLGSLGDLLREQGFEGAPEAEEEGAPGDESPTRLGRVVVRRERKGRRGKTVTSVDGLDLPEAGREALARELRTTLGCGARVEGEQVVVQGDQRERVAELIRGRARGVVVA